MKILVTGGAGFIGSNFIRHVLFSGNEHSVVNLDKLTYAGNVENLAAVASHPRYRFVCEDICNLGAVADVMRGCDSVVHFAAESHVDRSIYNPEQFIHTNIHGTLVLLKAAQELGLRRFVHVSTDEVYGDLPGDASADEAFPLRPSSPYSASKASADLLLGSFVRTYDFPGIIVRPSNNYGPYQFPEKFLPLVISNALEEKSISIYGDGLQQRNWLHVKDNCAAILTVLNNGSAGEVYNIGSSDALANLRLAQRVLTTLGKSTALLRHVTDRPGHDRRYALNSSKMTTKLGWKQKISLDEGLSSTIEWYLANAKWIADTKKRQPPEGL